MHRIPSRHPEASRAFRARSLAIALVAALAPPVAAAAARLPGYAYVSPVPGSVGHPVTTGIAIREGSALDPAIASPGVLRVRGERSGEHDGALALSDDRRTLVFRSAAAFEPGEWVTVRAPSGLGRADGGSSPPLEFSFRVSADPPRRAGLSRFAAALAAVAVPGGSRREAREGNAEPAHAPPGPEGAALPSGYLQPAVTFSDRPEPGARFIAPFRPSFRTDRGRLQIHDERGEPLFFRSIPGFAFDFKRQPNGLLTYFTLPATYLALDSAYTVVDSFKTGNGYETDEHDLQLLPNGHALLMSYDVQPVGMDTVVAGGRPDAQVIGLVLQELDPSKNVVFQWRSWDHFQITDMIECTGRLTDSIVDYVHANAVELDTDGNLLLCSRHMSEITKIDRQTGEVIWRFGPRAKNNQFAFSDDPRGFSHPHDIRRLPNGNLSLFDNGNCAGPPFYSRAVEYEVDETLRTARLVREIRQNPDVYGPFMGNAQRHDDGGWTIGWGGTGPDPKVTEVHPDGSRAFELSFGEFFLWTYRGFRFPWQDRAFTLDADSLDFGEVEFGESASRWLRVTNRRAAPMEINQLVGLPRGFSVATPLPLPLAPGAGDSLRIVFAPDSLGAFGGDLYARAVNDTELVAHRVRLRGTGTGQALSVDDVALPEGEPGAVTPFEFTVRLAAPAVKEVTFDWACEDSTAVAAEGDYGATLGSGVIPVGDSLTTLQVEVYGDSLLEPHEVFRVRLSHIVNAVGVRPVGRGVILHDEGALGIAGPDGRPHRFRLEPPRPNPARSRVALAYSLAERGRVTLAIFDLRGRRVATLADGIAEPGPGKVVWDARSQPAGVYFARLRVGGRSVSRPFTLVR